jgi:hypothetical protein
MKNWIPAISAVVVALVLYALQSPSFVILVGAVVTAVILSVRQWGRTSVSGKKARLAR